MTPMPPLGGLSLLEKKVADPIGQGQLVQGELDMETSKSTSLEDLEYKTHSPLVGICLEGPYNYWCISMMQHHS
jgi:hypothetical protein